MYWLIDISCYNTRHTLFYSLTPTAAPSPAVSVVPTPTAEPAVASHEITPFVAQTEHPQNAAHEVALAENLAVQEEETQAIQSPSPEATPNQAGDELAHTDQKQKSLLASAANVITLGTGSLLVAIGVLLIIGSVSTFFYMRFS